MLCNVCRRDLRPGEGVVCEDCRGRERARRVQFGFTTILFCAGAGLGVCLLYRLFGSALALARPWLGWIRFLATALALAVCVAIVKVTVENALKKLAPFLAFGLILWGLWMTVFRPSPPNRMPVPAAVVLPPR